MERHRAAQARGDAEADDADGAGGAAAAALWRGSEAEAAEVMVYHAAILRNKRLLLAYAARRLNLARELRWTRGGAPPAARAALSPGEAEFARGYARLLGGYCRSRELGGVGLDLTADAAPPADPFVQVRVLRDYGEAAFSCGSVKLRRGQSHWLPRDEAHPLVQDGVLECVGGE
jgi:GINS complex subunit 1